MSSKNGLEIQGKWMYNFKPVFLRYYSDLPILVHYNMEIGPRMTGFPVCHATC